MDSSYKQEVKRYGKKDAIIAVCAVLFFVAIVEIYEAILYITPIELEALPYIVRRLEWPIMKSVFSIVPIVIILSVTKQGLVSIGIHKENLWRGVRLGIMLSLIPILWGILPMALYGGIFGGFGLFTVLLIRTFMMAAAEDVLFVGFLQTRLSGFFKSGKLALCLGAALFSLMHVPPWLRTGQLSFDNLPHFGIMIMIWFTMHFVLVAVYRRYKSLIPVTILHVAVNFISSSWWVFADDYVGYAQSWNATTWPSLIIAVSVWMFILRRRDKKARLSSES